MWKLVFDFVLESWKAVLQSSLLLGVIGLWFQNRKERLERQRVEAEAKQKEQDAKQKEEEAKEKDSIRYDNQNSSEIYIILWRLLREYLSGRVFIFQFHNGGRYFSGKGMKRSTMSHEVSSFNIPRISADFQGHVMNDAFHDGIREMMELDYLYYPSVDKLPESGTKSMLRTYGSKAFFAVVFWDEERRDPIGCLCLCFGKEDPLSEAQVMDLRTRSEDVLHLVRN
jgi:hypothetical protein